MSHVEVFPGKRQNDYYFRTKAANGETVTVSEGYTREGDAVRAARAHVLEMKTCDNIVRVIPREKKEEPAPEPDGKGKEKDAGKDKETGDGKGKTKDAGKDKETGGGKGETKDAGKGKGSKGASK